MPNPFSHLHQKLRALVCAIVAVFLVIISLVIILTQFTEVSAKNENLSLASFLVILSFSGVAFQWSGVTAGFASPKVLKKVYQTGVDLFLDSILALIAAFFAWLQSTPELMPPWLASTCIVIHWVFLSLAVVFFLISMLCLLAAIKDVQWDTSREDGSR
jgi:hypothetical protein